MATKTEPERTDAVAVGCGSCALSADCGGLDEQQALWGCFTYCKLAGHCDRADWTCPCRPSTFVRRWRQVGGFPPPPPRPLQPMVNAALPLYVPMIQHGSSRTKSLALSVVAIPLVQVIRRRRSGRLQPRSFSPEALRSEFRVGHDARVLLVGIGPDEDLEIYWQLQEKDKAPLALAQLGLLGITTPNFSYFTDAPRPHTLWNRFRMLRLAEQMSDAGLPVVLHLNALTDADWGFWIDLLRQNPGMSYVVREFQTGNKSIEAGTEAVTDLRDLQNRVGRDLHPIAVGGASHVVSLARSFARFTVVDSRPFMNTMNRQRLIVSPDGGRQWKASRTTQGTPLDELLALNIRRYSESLAIQAAEAAKGSINQLSLPQVL